jgi:D-cysteine desulfhydrase
MGSSAGLALGLALAELPTEVHAVRVADSHFVNQDALVRLMQKTIVLLNRLDKSIPIDLMERTRLRWRDEFFAGGYAAVDDATQSAVAVAHEQLGLALETTYTGKAMAAMLHDLQAGDYDAGRYLFWNTYNSRPLPVAAETPASPQNMPAEFMRYFD